MHARWETEPEFYWTVNSQQSTVNKNRLITIGIRVGIVIIFIPRSAIPYSLFPLENIKFRLLDQFFK
ncbi:MULTISPECIES: hypothetical protein [unclassified Moorena]|uniref:hypothetical protein n=1 Tax=unclassified Moorena TaxID=2683338 RepID=UPI0013FEDE32|nr:MULTISPECIES: hypothetical protein [unclassified Moorena]NEO14230.1 hypothetical protein [Moorena sp. SIO3E8]NEQ00178.1 hypothetical protein [Moorena sp. SIO3F7]